MKSKSSQQSIERKKRIGAWLSKKENILLVALLLFALAIRIHYFMLTMDQPLWWDEAEYMLKAKNIALGTPDTGWAGAIRPILFSFIAAGSFLLGLGETPLRFALVLLSCAEIGLLFFMGKELFNVRVGAIAAFLMSIFYLDLFYTTRLLVDVPQITFIMLAAFLFVRYSFTKGSKQYAWFILPIIFIGTQMRFTVGLFALILFVFLLATQGLALFKKKEWYVSLIIAFITFVPYLIYAWITFGNPLYSIGQGLSSANSERGVGVTAFDIFMQYIHYFPSYTPLLFFILFIIGAAAVLFNVGIGLDRLRSHGPTQKYFFLLVWIVIPLMYFGFFVNHFEDRYLFMAFPPIFIVTALVLDWCYERGKKYSKIITIILILALLAYGGWKSLDRADDLIKSRITSYEGLRQAGLWVRENASPGEAVISAGMPQLTYYSEHPVYSYPLNESEMSSFRREKNATYMILSMWERSPEWTYEWPQENADKVALEQAFFLDEARTNPSAVIYRFND